MKKITVYSCLILACLIVSVWAQDTYSQTIINSCMNCHDGLDDELGAPVKSMNADVHFLSGVYCEQCHGGDSAVGPLADAEDSMDPDKGFTGVIERVDVPKFCNSCHGNANYMKQFNPNIRIDQYERYKSSKHGILIASGNEKAAVCSDCHNIHDMRSVNDPNSKVYAMNVNNTCGECHSDPEYMSDFNIDTDQNKDYMQSIHYNNLTRNRDLSSPTCNDCHGNHGAVPVGIASIENTCGSCHVSNKEHFDNSPHGIAFKEQEIADCITCHSNHAIKNTGEFMMEEDGGVCWNCHDADSIEGEKIIAIRDLLVNIDNRLKSNEELITLAETKGMEVGEYKVSLIDLRSHILRSRNYIHTISLEKIGEETAAADKIADEIEAGGQSALDEINTRRMGLIVSLVLILIVIGLLYMKIKALPKT